MQKTLDVIKSNRAELAPAEQPAPAVSEPKTEEPAQIPVEETEKPVSEEKEKKLFKK